MSSLVELKDACINKALEIVQSRDVQADDESELEVRSSALTKTVSAACMADAQANADSWAGVQSAGKEQPHG